MITDAQYLAYIHTPYEEPGMFRCFVGNGIAATRELNLRDIPDSWLVSYELPVLVPQFRSVHRPLPMRLVDVTEAARLIRGRPVSTDEENATSIWTLLRRQTQFGAAATQLYNAIYREGGRLSSPELDELMTQIVAGLRELWQRTEVELRVADEFHRFLNVEQPVGQLLLRTQYRGIRFNQELVNHQLHELGENAARAASELRMRWNVRLPTDAAELSRALGNDKRVLNEDVPDNPGLARAIRAGLDAALDFFPEDELVVQIKRFRAASHDKAILYHLSTRSDARAYPSFNVIGTVTGRALARTPALQYLSRRTRSILMADEGKVLLYPDFCQFEPGILADDSGAVALRRDFNTGDLYSALSKKVFGTDAHRDQAKLIFLAFCYGMSAARAAELLGSGHAGTSEIEVLIRSFFEEYPELELWRNSIHGKLLLEGRVGSRSGNFRNRVNADQPLVPSEKRWSLSQRIQGTASLILKRALLRVERAGIAELLLPMHDAALYQVLRSEELDAKSQIERIFIDTFREECPNLQPRVQFKDFAISVLGSAVPG